jgi:hypothetical protein
MKTLYITNMGARVKSVEVLRVRGQNLTGVAKAGMEAWIDALRNHGYKQTARRSRVGEAFDVYGVALDIMPEFGQWIRTESNMIYFQNKKSFLYARLLPPEVLKVLGIHSDVTAVNVHGSKIEKSLGTLNDEGATFRELADILEAYMGEGYEAPSWKEGNVNP